MSEPANRLRKEYDFDSWREGRAQDERLFAWQFRLFGHELEGWGAARIQQVTAPPAPPANLSVWRPERGAEQQLLAVDIYEAPFSAAAREQLLIVLGEFEGPQLERRNGPGEVAFGVGEAALLFARSNLVVLVRSVERMPVPVTPIAAQLDRYLTARPSASEAAGPEIRAFRALTAGPARPGQPVRLVVETSDRRKREGHVWYKFFSATGEIRLEDGQPVYVATGPGKHEIVLAAIDSDGNVTARALQLDEPR